MTVEQLTDGLRHYDPKLPVFFVVAGEQGRGDTHYPVELFDVKFDFRDKNPQRPKALLLKCKRT